MSPRVPPGARIGAGTIQVDPRRAIEKLREFQLADPAGWVLEVIRAAAGFGASALEVRGDSDEVWVSWEGPTPSADDLASLFGQLLSPQHGREGRARRLLAIGVNSALGTRPRRVDVYLASSAETERFRYSPTLLEGAGGEAPLEPERTLVEARADLPARGLAVHVVRPLGLATLRVFVVGGEPPELRVALAACGDLSVSLEIQGTKIAPPGALVRLPLDDGLDGFVELVDPKAAEGRAGGVLDAAELGVVMARLPFQPAGLVGPEGAMPPPPLPLRVFVSAERLPANASRSALRPGESPIPEASARADELVPALVEALARELSVAEGERRGRLRAAALALVAACVGGAGFLERLARRAVPDALRPLLELPLLADAHGRPRTLVDFDGAKSGAVHVGDEPISLDLEPWVGGIPWLPPGDEARRLLRGAPAPPIAPLLEAAEATLSARAAFFAHARVEARLPEGPDQWLSVRIEAPPIGLAAELEGGGVEARGEVVILDPRARRPGLSVQLLFEGRPIERVEVHAAMPMDAVVECAAFLPRPDYRALVADGAHRGALHEVVRAALSALEALADPREGEHQPRPGLPSGGTERGRARLDAAIRTATGTALTLFAAKVTQGNPERRARTALLGAASRLAGARVWPAVAEGSERLVELRAIAERAQDPVLVGRPGAKPGAMPTGGYFCVRLDAADELALARALADVRTVYFYDATRGAGEREAIERMLSSLGGPGRAALAVRASDHRAVVAWGEAKSEVSFWHRGVRLVTRPWAPSFGPCAIAVDHDGIVPTSGWDGVLAEARPPADLRALEGALPVAYAEHLLGRPRPDLRLLRGTADDRLKRALLLALANGAALPDDVRAGVRALPLVARLAPHAAVALDELAAKGGAPLLFVEPAEARIDFDPGDFDPIVADRELARAVAGLVGREATPAGGRLPELARVRRRAEQRALHLRGPLAELELADVALETALDTAAGPGRIGLRRGPGGLEIEVRAEGRTLVRIGDAEGPPVRCHLAVADSEIDAEYAGLTAEGRARVDATVRSGIRALLAAMVAQTPELTAQSATAQRFVQGFLAASYGGDDGLVGVLREGLLFPGLRGERVSVATAREKQRVVACSFAAEWLGPGSNERATRLDGPVLLVPEGVAGASLRGLLESLASPLALDDATTEARELQSRRRVAQGRVPAPRVEAPDPRLAARIADVAGKSRALSELGVGEIALAPGESSVVCLFELGEPVARLTLDVAPAVAVALESPRLAAELDGETKKLSKDALRRLRKRVEGLRASLARRILRELPRGIEPWARASLRFLALSDEGFTEGYRDAPLFEATDGRLLSLAELRLEPPDRRPIWATPEPRSTARAIDGARPVLRLSPAEIGLLAKHVPVIDGRAALAREAAERAFLARPTVDVHSPPSGIEALGAIRWEGGGASRRGICVALLPGSMDARGLEIAHAGRILARLDDPADWPCFARVEDPALAPADSFDAVVPGAALEKLRKAVREAVEGAVLAALEPSGGADCLTVGRKLGGAQDVAAVRGTVYLGDGARPAELELVDAHGCSTFGVDVEGPPGKTAYRLPIAGRLFTTAGYGAPQRAELRRIVRAAYAALVRLRARAAAETKGDDATLAHVVRAVAVGAIAPRDPSLSALRWPCFRPEPQTIAEVARLLGGAGPVIVATPEELVAATPDVRALVDDGTLASRALLEHLRGRVERPHARWRSLLGLGPGVGDNGASPEPSARPGSRAKASAKAKSGAASVEAREHRRRAKEGRSKAAPGHPFKAIAGPLERLLRRVGLGGEHLTVVDVRASSARPLLAYDAHARRLFLAGESPLLRALLPMIERRDPRAEEALVVLAAHAAGVLNRALAPVTDAAEAAALAALLEELAPP